MRYRERNRVKETFKVDLENLIPVGLKTNMDENGEDEYSSSPFELEVRRAIVKHLDANGTLKKLEEAGLEYKEVLDASPEVKRGGVLPSFIFTTHLDVTELAEISCEVGNLALENPLLFQRLVREVVHCALTTLCSLPTMTLDLVQVVPRVSSLPAERGLRTDGANKLPAPCARRLLLLQGVAVAVTAPAKYTRSAVFRCPNLTCPGAAGLRVWGPRASRRRCRFCAGVAEETPRGRDIGEQTLAMLVPPSALQQAAEASGDLNRSTPAVSHPTLVRFC
ncbi:Minichromosome maintenance domain-containing protein 2, partial [Frankliniella fusca]